MPISHARAPLVPSTLDITLLSDWSNENNEIVPPFDDFRSLFCRTMVIRTRAYIYVHTYAYIICTHAVASAVAWIPSAIEINRL